MFFPKFCCKPLNIFQTMNMTLVISNSRCYTNFKHLSGFEIVVFTYTSFSFFLISLWSPPDLIVCIRSRICRSSCGTKTSSWETWKTGSSLYRPTPVTQTLPWPLWRRHCQRRWGMNAHSCCMTISFSILRGHFNENIQVSQIRFDSRVCIY